MSRWDRYRPAPKKPPPKRGIKMRTSGSTWWGKRWIEALERISYGYSNRLPRGRTYARAGRIHDLVIDNSKVTAKVTGSRSTPYEVTISLVRLGDEAWDMAIAAMAQKAQFSAELLGGQMPQEIDAAFQAAGASIFPSNEADLRTSCSCPDWANPCKHVAATHYILGEALDRDPFLLFELRGREKAQVLEALRAARTEEGALTMGRDGPEETDASAPVPSVTLGRIKADDWDKPPVSLPSLRLSFEAPPISGGLLRQLGTPSGWSSDASPVEVLGPMIRAAAERARALAMAQVTDEQEGLPKAETPCPVKSKPVRAREGIASRGATTMTSKSKKKSAAKKSAAKKTTAKKTTTKKSAVKKSAVKKSAAKPKLLAGGNPQIAKADGDAPVQAYLAAMPGWKREVGRRLDALIVRNVPNVRKAVKWNSPFYGIEGQGFFLTFHCFTKYIKVAFFRGTSLRPLPPVESKDKEARYFHVHEGDPLEEAQVAAWIRQAAALPGWIP